MSESSRPDAARRGLAEAAAALAEFRRLAGAGEPPGTEEPRPPVADAVLRAALDDARARVRRLESELAAARRALAAADEDRKRLEAAAARSLEGTALKERAALLEAEVVRLESLRRLSERGAADERARAAQAEDALRRDLARAQDALERSAASTAASEARAKAELDALRGRLEWTVSRLQAVEQESRLERAREGGDAEAYRFELERAQAAIARLREELTAARGAVPEPPPAAPAAASAAPLPDPLVEDWEAGPSAPPEPPEYLSPALEPLLDPGWARLLRLVRPPVEAAYAQLRRLSATPLVPGQKALLKMAAASLAQATDSLASVELSLEDGPAPGAPAPAGEILESSLAAWEPAFRRRGVVLQREVHPPLPEAVHEPKALRVLLYHGLRNALEALPRGGRLSVSARRGPDGGLRVELLDDGPGYPKEWLERRFEPFAAPRRGRAGLGLSIVRRTMRRWGGEAEAGAGVGGRGARLTLSFPPPPPKGVPAP